MSLDVHDIVCGLPGGTCPACIKEWETYGWKDDPFLPREREPMKVNFRLNDKVTIQAEGDTPADVFAELSIASEIFGSQKACGCCGGDYKFLHYVAQGYTFYKLKCVKCSAQFGFGQLKDVKGGLFPQLKDKAGNPKPNGGWEVYQQQ